VAGGHASVTFSGSVPVLVTVTFRTSPFLAPAGWLVNTGVSAYSAPALVAGTTWMVFEVVMGASELSSV
jgi:hypothetical protein